MQKILACFLFFILSVPFSNVHADHVLDIEAFAQYLDISQLESEKFSFEFDNVSYDIFYGFHGSMDDSMSDDFGDPVVKEMRVNQERKSIQVDFDHVPGKTDFWVRIPFPVLSADGEKYQLLIDSVDTGYDIMKMPDGYVIGMIIDKDTRQVEIIGTHVIPEFDSSILVLGSSILAIVYVVHKFSLVKRIRIN